MPADPSPPTYSLDDLAVATGIPERTIRSYIGRGLLPPPEGRGRGASYGAEHLTRLQFLVRVRAAVTYELPLDVLKRLLAELPAEQIARIARGDETVSAVPLLGALDTMLLRRKRYDSEPPDTSQFAAEPVLQAPGPRLLYSLLNQEPPSSAKEVSPSERKPPSKRDGLPETWTTLQVTPDVRLSMRGQAPRTARQLTELAERIRQWLAKEKSP